jgi:hypothetical protein
MVVLNVASRKEKRNRPSLANGAQLFNCRIMVELCKITSTELLPAVDTMVKPFAQFGAWRDLLEPNYFAQLFFADPAGPNTVHQNALPVSRGSLFIDSFDLQICHIRLGFQKNAFYRPEQAALIGLGPASVLQHQGSVKSGPDGAEMLLPV